MKTYLKFGAMVVVIVGVLPLMGIVAYLLLGEVNIGRRRVKRLHAVLKSLPQIPAHPAGDPVESDRARRERDPSLLR